MTSPPQAFGSMTPRSQGEGRSTATSGRAHGTAAPPPPSEIPGSATPGMPRNASIDASPARIAPRARTERALALAGYREIQGGFGDEAVGIGGGLGPAREKENPAGRSAQPRGDLGQYGPVPGIDREADERRARGRDARCQLVGILVEPRLEKEDLQAGEDGVGLGR